MAKTFWENGFVARHAYDPSDDSVAESAVSALYRARPIQLPIRVYAVRARLRQDGEAAAAALGLELVHVSILHVLGLRGPMRMGEMADRVSLHPASMSRRAKQLEERGLVVRERSVESNREVEIRLTDAGQVAFEQTFRDVHDRHAAYFDAHLTAAEQQQLLALLSKLP